MYLIYKRRYARGWTDLEVRPTWVRRDEGVNEVDVPFGTCVDISCPFLRADEVPRDVP